MPTTTTRPATEKQVDYLIDLGKRFRAYVNQLPDDSEAKPGFTALLDAMGVRVRDGIDRDTASGFIDALKQLLAENRVRSQTPAGSEPQPGMYRQPDGTIVRVYLGQNSGRMLLKQLVGTPHGERTHEYEYVGAASKHLHAEAQPLTLEEAKEFGRMTGTCCVCARRLDVPESVEAGIGPVCAGRMEEGFTK